MTLSYSVPNRLLPKTKVLSQVRIYGSANNLFYVTKFSGYSPEPPVNSSGQITGIYAGTYPTPRTYVFGAAVSF